jgi:hypothetical protein
MVRISSKQIQRVENLEVAHLIKGNDELSTDSMGRKLWSSSSYEW